MTGTSMPWVLVGVIDEGNLNRSCLLSQESQVFVSLCGCVEQRVRGGEGGGD